MPLKESRASAAPSFHPEVAYVTAAHASSFGEWRPDYARPPLFLVPGAGASGRRAFAPLSDALGGDWPICVLADPSCGGKPDSVEDLARGFTSRIVEAQPAGPYVVGGHGFGGVVAYEVAKQLLSGGRLVRLLVVIDTPRPGYPNPLRHPHVFAAGGALFVTRAMRRPNALLGLKRAAEALLRRGWRCGHGTVERAAARLGTGFNDRAMRMYRPKPLRAPALLVISRENSMTGSPLDRRLGWMRCIEPRPALGLVGGDHNSILQDGNAGEVARHLTRALGPPKNLLMPYRPRLTPFAR